MRLQQLPHWCISLIDLLKPLLLLVWTERQIEMILLTRRISCRNLNPPFCGTCSDVAALMVQAANSHIRKLFTSSTILRVLEPSAGNGDLILHFPKIINKIYVKAIESHYERAIQCHKICSNLSIDVGVHWADYNKEKGFKKHDVIIMNPPYENKEYIRHIENAIFRDIDRKGVVISLVPECVFYEKNYRAKTFRKMLKELNAEVSLLGEGPCKYPVQVCMIAIPFNNPDNPDDHDLD